MMDGFSKLKGRGRLPDPPADSTRNLEEPETAPAPRQEMEVEAARPEPPTALDDMSPRPRVDGRTRLRKDRTEALSTKIKPRHRELLMALADAYESTLSETLEKAIEALEQQARLEGRRIV